VAGDSEKTIKQGEHVARIADEAGFAHYSRVWDDPRNSELKGLRENPNVLFPRDRLFVPDFETRDESGATEQRHRFRRHRSLLRLRLVLRDVNEEPIASTACELTVGTKTHELTTDAQGLIEQQIPFDATVARLVVPNQEDRDLDLVYDLQIGHLDPLDTTSGRLARLDNLGYFMGHFADYEQIKEQRQRWALEEFQCEHGLPDNGVYDTATKKRLEDVYGC